MTQAIEDRDERELEPRACAGCAAVLWEQPELPRLPCPSCGVMGRRIDEALNDTAVMSDGYRFKQHRPGIKRALVEERNEDSYFVSAGEWHRRFMHIDRENDVYRERIVRVSTGEVLMDKHEKLSEHIGHGSAKKPRRLA